MTKRLRFWEHRLSSIPDEHEMVTLSCHRVKEKSKQGVRRWKRGVIMNDGWPCECVAGRLSCPWRCHTKSIHLLPPASPAGRSLRHHSYPS